MSQFLTGRRRLVAFLIKVVLFLGLERAPTASGAPEGRMKNCPSSRIDNLFESWEVAVSFPSPARVPTVSVVLLEAHKLTRLSCTRKEIGSLVSIEILKKQHLKRQWL